MWPKKVTAKKKSGHSRRLKKLPEWACIASLQGILGAGSAVQIHPGLDGQFLPPGLNVDGVDFGPCS